MYSAMRGIYRNEFHGLKVFTVYHAFTNCEPKVSHCILLSFIGSAMVEGFSWKTCVMRKVGNRGLRAEIKVCPGTLNLDNEAHSELYASHTVWHPQYVLPN